ncbi:HAMP domain-containing histidine kinase [Dactylosporangium vinaceum]|uniref:Sensor-like histidine kinase SenX3 n=1 Tax=Dactylosporangium vinaceum TaxID=53362 RepID=A0ABV5MCV0_9ACTN|nr:HAMP domain-containing sensor histidine kinase [Dactylosporangium vinaceum]UAC00742.1 HAMP domain-containing histidine kinase [Dactylosporangium vinaceum]
MNRPDPDRDLLRRARRSLAVRHTVVIALILLAVGAVALYVVAREERAALTASVRQTAATEEDVVDPPAGSWIFRIDAAGGLTATDDAPPGFPDRAALARVRAGGAAEQAESGGYLVITRPHGDATVQVVGSLAAQQAETQRLLAALGGAELLGLAAAVVAGLLLARHATAPLGEALARQRRFVADASHELRTPIAQLHTRAQLLDQELRSGAAAADIAPDARRLVAGTRQLGEIVEDLLLSTQLAGRAEIGGEVDLGVVADGVVAGFRHRAEAARIELSLRLDPDRPSTVHGRPAALRRVVNALLDNAFNHTAPGGHIAVELHNLAGPPQVRLTVRDDGTGFDPADADRLFDRFARGHDDHRRFGLGLALAHEVVTGHGGTITAAAGPAGGAVFTIHLPLRAG